MAALQLVIVFCLGFFAIVSQTLLFREFISIYEGNELGIGAFFGSWLLWVAVGALVGRNWKARNHVRRFEFLLLLYIPAYLLQQQLILFSRQLAGVTAFELFPFTRMFPVSLIVNAPVSFVTGLLFVLGCRWVATKAHSAPVAKVYMFEALGSTCGGVLVTLALGFGCAVEIVFLYAAIILTMGISLYRLINKRRYMVLVFPLLLVALLVADMDVRWTQWRERMTWKRLLPVESYQGSFTTPHAKYLYGEYDGQFTVMAWESIVDTIAVTERASEIAALHLAQHPTVRRVLIVGPDSYSLCQRFLVLPQIEHITWLHPDQNYPRQLQKILPATLRLETSRLEIPVRDVRAFVRETQTEYDLVILNSFDATTLSLNRYFTREFLLLLKKCLSPNAVIGLRGVGGDNFMGPELARLGASVLHTLESVYDRVVIKPGDETWFIASETVDLTVDSDKLQQQYTSIVRASNIYPSAGLHSLYQKDRIEFQRNKYQQVINTCDSATLLNTDKKPTVLLHSLLFLGRHLGGEFSLAGHIDFLSDQGWKLMLFAIVLLVLMRKLYIRNSSQILSVHFLVFTTGFAGLGMSMLLLYAFQSQHGSIFLYIGMVSALYMFGLYLGCFCANKFMAAREQLFLRCGLSLHILFCLLLIVLPPIRQLLVFAALFLSAGLLGGIYVPLAAAALSKRGHQPQQAGSIIDVLDHLGGAAGGLLVGLILLPFWGTEYTLWIFITILAANYLNFSRTAPSTDHGDMVDQRARAFGYILIGLLVLMLVGRQSWTSKHATEPSAVIQDQRLQSAAQEMLPTTDLALGTLQTEDDLAIEYYSFGPTDDQAAGYIFSTEYFAKGIKGYAGPIVLAVRIDEDGQLRDLRVLSSRETPEYILEISNRWSELFGKNIFQNEAFKNVDILTGATYSSRAIHQTVQLAGKQFGALISAANVSAESMRAGNQTIDVSAAVLVVLCLTALMLRRRYFKLPRYVFLIITLILSGFLLNQQYSLFHVMTLLKLEMPALGFRAPFLLVVVVPIFVILFGNIYCGYLCPFGALQELAGKMIPSRWCLRPHPAVWRYGRWVKYVLLYVSIIGAFVITGNKAVSADPLVTVWNFGRVPIIAILAVCVSLVFGRFWCRNLCPTGAFLALLNGISKFSPFSKAVPWPRCTYGVRGPNELDCICCDRCFNGERKNLTSAKSINRCFLAAVAVLAAAYLLLMAGVSRQTDLAPISRAAKLERGAVVAGESRNLDPHQIRKLIHNKRLSDRQALYYRRITN